MTTETTNDFYPLENQIFIWRSWDELDFMALQFYECTLKTDIGQYKAGDHIPVIAMILDKSIIEFYDELGNVIFTGSIKVSVVPNEIKKENYK